MFKVSFPFALAQGKKGFTNPRYILISPKTRFAAVLFQWLIVASSTSRARRRMSSSRSSLFKNFAVSGQSGMIQYEMTATTKVKMPSRMKIHRQPPYPAMPAMCAMAYAW